MFLNGSVSAPAVATLGLIELLLGEAIVSVVLVQLLTGQISFVLIVC